MDISTGIANDTKINQLAGAHSVLTAAVVNTNDVHTSQSKSLYPALPYYFGKPEGGGPKDISTGIENETAVNQLAGPRSVLTAAVVNTNDVDASQKSMSPYSAFPFFR
jgi:uncharacterized membrane protein YvbJ